MTDRPSRITKLLSANDTGETGAHQAGILVPKEGRVLRFFPLLDSRDKNPRCLLHFSDDWQDRWTFAFIYYNNRFFGGTRNEFRLTRMTSFFRRRNAKAGDAIVLSRDKTDAYSIRIARSQAQGQTSTRQGRLALGTAWKVIDV